MIRGIWTRETVALMLLAAHLPVAAAWAWFGGLDAITRLGFAFTCVAFWHLVFLFERALRPSGAGITTAIAIAILMPPEAGIFALALSITFGVVLAELVFGGWGRNVVHPATAALAFLGFGFPTYEWPTFDLPVAWATVPAALIGMATGVMPAGIIVFASAVGLAAYLNGFLETQQIVAAVIVLVILVADPVASASTGPGRWVNGAVYASLVALFSGYWPDAAPVQAAVAAALLASLTAPAADEFSVAIWLRLRRRQHGRT